MEQYSLNAHSKNVPSAPIVAGAPQFAPAPAPLAQAHASYAQSAQLLALFQKKPLLGGGTQATPTSSASVQQQQQQNVQLSPGADNNEQQVPTLPISPPRGVQAILQQYGLNSASKKAPVGAQQRDVLLMSPGQQQVLKKPLNASSQQQQQQQQVSSILNRRTDAITQNLQVLFNQDRRRGQTSSERQPPQEFEEEIDNTEIDAVLKPNNSLLSGQTLGGIQQHLEGLRGGAIAPRVALSQQQQQQSPDQQGSERNNQQIKFLLCQLKESEIKVQYLEDDNQRIRRERADLQHRVIELENQVRELQMQMLRMQFTQQQAQPVQQPVQQRQILGVQRAPVEEPDVSFNRTGDEFADTVEAEEEKDAAEGEANIENSNIPQEEQDLIFAMQLQAAEHRQMYQQNEDIDPDAMTYEQLIELGERIGTVSKGFQKEQIKSIAKFTYDADRHAHLDQCAVCYCEFAQEEVLRQLTPCQHIYHSKCIKNWLTMEKKCPMCKTEVQISAQASVTAVPEQQRQAPRSEIVEEQEEQKRMQ